MDDTENMPEAHKPVNVGEEIAKHRKPQPERIFKPTNEHAVERIARRETKVSEDSDSGVRG